MLIAVVKAIIGIVLLGGVWLAAAAPGRRGGVEAGRLTSLTHWMFRCGLGLCQPPRRRRVRRLPLSPPAMAGRSRLVFLFNEEGSPCNCKNLTSALLFGSGLRVAANHA